MTDVLAEDYISEDDLLEFQNKYYTEQRSGNVSKKTQFEYGWCLIRTQYKEEIREGIKLLEELCTSNQDQRDFLFFIAVGYYKLGDYNTALRYAKRLLQIEPNNHQAKDLESSIEKKMKSEALHGVAITGGAIVGGIAGAVGAALYLGYKVLRR